MSAARELIQDLERAGVTLYLDGERLRYRAAPGLVTDSVKQAVAEFRPDIVAYLAHRAGYESLQLGAEGGKLAAPARHPGEASVKNPEAHFAERERLYPQMLRPTLGAIARAWSYTRPARKAEGDPERKHIGESLRREYSRLAGWADNAPHVVTAPWLAEQLARYEASQTAPVAPACAQGWGEDAALVAWVAALTQADLPPLPFGLRAGVRVTGSAFLANLQAEVAAGPRVVTARHGVLQRNIRDLREAIARAAAEVEIVDIPPPGSARKSKKAPDNGRRSGRPMGPGAETQ